LKKHDLGGGKRNTTQSVHSLVPAVFISLFSFPSPHKMSTDHLQNTTIEQLGKIVSDPSLPIAKRMRAIFSLRNLGTNEAVDALKKCTKISFHFFTFLFHSN
jgi:hypothetical protein